MPMPATYGTNSVAAYYGIKSGRHITQADIKRAMQSAAAAKAEHLATTQRQLRAVQKQIKRSESIKPAAKAAEQLTAKDVAVGVGAVSGGVLFWLLGVFALFSVLALGPVGLLLIIVLAVGAGSGNSSSSKRSRKPKVTGFYCPYYPSRR